MNLLKTRESTSVQRSWQNLKAKTKISIFLRRYANYFRFHFSYIATMGMLGGMTIFIFEWLFGTMEEFGVVDAFFTSFSAISATGLITVNFSKMTIMTKLSVLFLIQAGNIVGLTTIPLFTKYVFMSRYLEKLERQALLNRLNTVRVLSPAEQLNLEFLALRTLLGIVVLYIVVVYSAAIAALSFYFFLNSTASGIIASHTGDSPLWWTLFHVVSAFSNAGFSLFPDSLVIFQRDAFVLGVIMFLISMGNVAYPIVLRLIIFVMYKTSRDYAVYKYLLDHSRESFTHMFPTVQTAILAMVWILVNTLQMIMFLGFEFEMEILNVPLQTKLLISLFQAVTTRTAGFNVVDMGVTVPTIQVVTCIFMYLAVYPFVLTLHESQKIEKERVLISRLYNLPDAEEPEEILAEEPAEITENVGRVGNLARFHMQKLMLRDITWIIVALLVICTMESSKIQTDTHVSVFYIAWELASAYGTVGLSLGYPGVIASLSGVFHPISKLMVILVMLLGKHRGLPTSLDVAVKLNLAPLPVQDARDDTDPANQDTIQRIELKRRQDEMLQQFVNSNTLVRRLDGVFNTKGDFDKSYYETIQRGTSFEVPPHEEEEEKKANEPEILDDTMKQLMELPSQSEVPIKLRKRTMDDTFKPLANIYNESSEEEIQIGLEENSDGFSSAENIHRIFQHPRGPSFEGHSRTHSREQSLEFDPSTMMPVDSADVESNKRTSLDLGEDLNRDHSSKKTTLAVFKALEVFLAKNPSPHYFTIPNLPEIQKIVKESRNTREDGDNRRLSMDNT